MARMGMSWKQLLEHNPTPYRSFEEWNQYYVYKKINQKTGKPTGFFTPSDKLELYGEVFIHLGTHSITYPQ